MLDIRLIRENPELVRHNLKKRNDIERLSLLEKLIRADAVYRERLQEQDTLRHQRNLKTEEMRKRKEEGEDIEKYRQEIRELLDRMKAAEEATEKYKAEVDALLYKIPNMLDDTVPVGRDDTENVVVRTWGKMPEKWERKGHEELALSLGLLDMERAAKISGARFYFLKNELVLLDHALQRFALDHLRKKNFQLVQPPYLMGRKAYEGVVDLGDFDNVMYKVEGEDLSLIATAEHPLVAQYMNETLSVEQLPIKLAGISPCFRKEAGAHGKDTKGIFRVHQFHKVEQVIFSRPEESWHLHEELIKNTEEMFQALEIPYRVVNVCTGDIGSIAAKKYDLEVWMPVQGTYREAASCSNCTDYQARRLKIKYAEKGKAPLGLVHTLNNTAIATSRVLVAILEHYQQKDGSVLVPKVLVPYTGFKKIG